MNNKYIELKLQQAISSIESRLLETKTPCKLYSTSARANAAAAKVAEGALDFYGAKSVKHYFVKIPSVNKYAVVFHASPLLNEHGGYAGWFAERGFYSF